MVMFRILFLSLLFTIHVLAQNISVKAKTDTSDYLIGDFINLTFIVKTDKNIHNINPDFKQLTENVELIRQSEPDSNITDSRKEFTYSLIVSHYDSSRVTIPGIPFSYNLKNDETQRVKYSNPITFNVHTLPVEPDKDISDVKEPIKIPLDWWMIALIALIIIIAGIATYFLYKRLKARREGIVIPEKIIVIPPGEKALSELNQLEKEKVWQSGKVKEFHSRITQIIRTYFEEKLSIPVLESTTTETLTMLKKVEASSPVIETTSRFLNNADLVKFAKYIPMETVNEEMMSQAKEIVTTTESHYKQDEPEEVNAG